jgi:hypothetical protein
MSEGERDGKASQPEGVGAVPAEDAESAWLRARRQDPGAPPPSPALVRAHAQLESLLGNLPPIRADDSWHDDVLKAAIRAHQRTTRRRWTATVLGAAAVVSAIWLWPARRPREPWLDVQIDHPNGPTRGAGGEAAIGDLLIVRAQLEPGSDLRVYRDRTDVLARCPHGPGCRSSGANADDPLIHLALDVPGEYDVLLVAGADGPLPDGPMDTFLAAARNTNARIASHRVDVR